MNNTRKSRPVKVAEAIKDWVVSKGLKVGDRLPNEQQMIERFGMSKGTVREAMRILEAEGLIKTRTGPGGGSFVHEVSKERARSLLSNYFYFKNLTISDIYELRSALEPELAASLAGKLSKAVLAQLEENIAIHPQPAETVEEEREQHITSLKFHALLAAQSDNTLMEFLIDFLVKMLSDLTVYRELYKPLNQRLWKKGRAYQSQLIEALRSGDSESARHIMKEHMTTAKKFMEGQEAEMLRRFMTE